MDAYISTAIGFGGVERPGQQSRDSEFSETGLPKEMARAGDKFGQK
jgi:hypothetical protein